MAVDHGRPRVDICDLYREAGEAKPRSRGGGARVGNRLFLTIFGMKSLTAAGKYGDIVDKTSRR